MTPLSLQLLEKLQIGHQLSVDELNQLVDQKTPEDLYLEYKHGNVLLDNKKANDILREYLSGFANSAGGVLIIGVDQNSDGIPTYVTGCHGHNKGKLTEWAARCLTPIANYFSPQPRFQVVNHPNGDVLLAVTPRSPGLVPRTEAANIVYHFRIHDQTLKAPEYLLADLLLGRRQQPVFDIVDWHISNLRRAPDNSLDAMDLEFQLNLKTENRGFVWAENSQWGLIAWTNINNQPYPNLYKTEITSPSNYLLKFIDVQNVSSDKDRRPKQLLHFRSTTNIDKPFDSWNQKISFNIPLRLRDHWFSYTWKASLYLLARNSLPVWYQLSFNVGMDIVKFVDGESQQILRSDEKITITRQDFERPVVVWDGFSD